MNFAACRIKRDREKSVRNRHPWIYSGAIQEVEAGAAPGDVVDVVGQEGEWLGRGFYNPASEIAVHLFSWDRAETPCDALWAGRLARALELRRSIGADPGPDGAFRMVHSDSDLLPGLVVDRYAGFLVFQFLVLGMDRLKDLVVAEAMKLTGAKGAWERSDTDARGKEGMGRTHGPLAGEEPPVEIEIDEAGARLLVDVRNGHKTGFYLDQAENRIGSRAFMRGRKVLNCFCYTGGFSVSAAMGGAVSVTSVDSSRPALETAARNMELNGFSGEAFTLVNADVPSCLRRMRDEGVRFDAVILDPPRYVANRDALQRGARAYKDINMLAMSLLEPGGLLFTFSCSGLMGEELFQKVVFSASADSGRNMRIVGRLAQAPDHPVLLSYPQAGYLKGLILQGK
ncbi:MAG TPA: class I SAM-dependent rRNA methyltransferase [Candidatus Fermentibacter daniensis]|nr:MAG: Ribosomal RNA large subunit methyltransferase I [candidate division Hyd24-12 bacterium ADurb.Bin004]HOZ18123.1 class I SAM-dependent rRNA methyltransferase [Candidatus Fermentibacter daniensis]